uniref:Uncharacterized protein n=1 Tax=Nelumbo nucifera TaxID=4432 RepID=A0A822Z8A0_NELNU|nr:TPA_asm: hypothetical protein HUJ06_014028 [Nelumbo nucifera]
MDKATSEGWNSFHQFTRQDNTITQVSAVACYDTAVEGECYLKKKKKKLSVQSFHFQFVLSL